MTATKRPGHFEARVDGTTYTDRAAFEEAANRAKLYDRGSDDAGEGKVKAPSMPRLTKRPRQFGLTKPEREGALAVGSDVTLRVEFLGALEEITGQVWALGPENGVWVATTLGRFFWVHKPSGSVHARPENHWTYAPIGRVA